MHVWRLTANKSKLIDPATEIGYYVFTYAYARWCHHLAWMLPLLKRVLLSKIAKKSIKPLLLRSRSSKVIEFSGNREPMYDFLLAINNNLGPISHRYWNTATYRQKIANFSFSFSALLRSDPLQIYGKALRFLKLESSRQRRWRFGNPSLHRLWLIHLCDRQTADGRTDRIAMAKTRWRQQLLLRVKIAVSIRWNRKLR